MNFLGLIDPNGVRDSLSNIEAFFIDSGKIPLIF